MKDLMIAIGLFGAAAGALSAFWWLKAAKVQPVYNSAMLGTNPDEVKRIDTMARLNAIAAQAAAVAVFCQAALLLLSALQSST